MSKFKLTQTAAEVQDILNNFNSLKSDAEGNLTVGKNLGVDGKLTLKSLVSASNPDGDITKELGGGTANKLYKHTITWSSSSRCVYLTIYNTSIEQIDSELKLKDAITKFGSVVATGYVQFGTNYYTVSYAYRNTNDQTVKAVGWRQNTEGDLLTTTVDLDYRFSTKKDDVKQVR